MPPPSLLEGREMADGVGQFYVYAVAVDCQVVYIGKGKGRRAFAHLGPRCQNPKLRALISDARQRNKTVRVRKLKAGLTEAEALKLERRWIARFHERLTNATLGNLSPHEKLWFEQVAEWATHRHLSDEEIKQRGPYRGLSVEYQIELGRLMRQALIDILKDVRARIPGEVPPIQMRMNDLIIIQ